MTAFFENVPDTLRPAAFSFSIRQYDEFKFPKYRTEVLHEVTCGPLLFGPNCRNLETIMTQRVTSNDADPHP